MTARTKQQLYDRFCSGGSAKNSISQIETEFEDLIDTFYGDWTTYHNSSTIVGWSSYTGLLIEYIKSGDLVYVNFRIYGTSDAATTTFTLPYAEDSDSSLINTCLCEDNGTRAIGFLNLSDSTVTFTKDATSASNAWTTSGDKEIYGQFWYKAA